MGKQNHKISCPRLQYLSGRLQTHIQVFWFRILNCFIYNTVLQGVGLILGREDFRRPIKMAVNSTELHSMVDFIGAYQYLGLHSFLGTGVTTIASSYEVQEGSMWLILPYEIRAEVTQLLRDSTVCLFLWHKNHREGLMLG